jgi:selenocysteine-specific elongation factor
MKHFVVATAGHVDHGKSSLVKALTGTDPDRLPEEKARQITIDLGFAELNLTGTDGEEIHAAIVDVPGHEDFVRNMIAGVGSVDLALFVIAADDGWMPQTEEHLQILSYLGVNRAVIALTKIDIGDAAKVGTQIREQLRETSLADSPIVPVSVRNNVGLEELRAALAAQLSRTQPQPDIGKARLFVDRAFTLRGIGTVVTGTLSGGTLRRGETISVQPRQLTSRVRSLQSHGRDVDLAQPGTRTAINLPELQAGNEIARGNVVTNSDFESSTTLDVVLQRSPRLGRVAPIKSGTSVYLHHGTARVLAKVILLQDEALCAGETAIAQLRLASPVLAFLGDRFVVRDASGQHTIAGGVVLDPAGDEKKFRADHALLSSRATAHHDVDLCVATEIARHGWVRRSRLLRQSRFAASEVADALDRLHSRKEILVAGEIAADVPRWQTLREEVIRAIDRAHEKNSERAGVELAELRAQMRDQAPELFEAVIVDLSAKDFVRFGSTIARRSHQAGLPAALRATAVHIRKLISAKPFDPPSRKEIERDAEAKNVVRFFIEQGELIEVGSDTLLSAKAFAAMKETIVSFISAHGPATVSQLRQTLGTSRRIVVPLLELLDRTGLTQRCGDERKLANKPVTAASRALN